jgi:hypothetical protein
MYSFLIFGEGEVGGRDLFALWMEQEGHRGKSKYGMFSPWPPAKTVRKKNRRNDICGTKLVKDF